MSLQVASCIKLQDEIASAAAISAQQLTECSLKVFDTDGNNAESEA